MIELFLPHFAVVSTLVTYIAVVEVMVFLAFGRVALKNNLKMVFFIYLVVFLLNGIMNAFHINDNMWKVLLVVFFACGLLNVGIKKIFAIMGEQSVIYITKITEENKTVCVKALKDTGNNLMDPFTNKPVSIIEKDKINLLISEKTRKLYIPFKSVGKDKGIMEACFIEQMEVEGRKYRNAVLGLYEGKLSKNNEYNMILHPKLFELGGNEFD